MAESDRAEGGRTLFTLLSAQAERFADRPAVVAGGRRTYRELLAAATRVAGGLAARGIGRGSRVG
ncbi:MAG: AMP-binding protein, partial [Alphaproteobacteria bacterium]|nr:AMP-binding protein [Alphaproteobacteria bacterium]